MKANEGGLLAPNLTLCIFFLLVLSANVFFLLRPSELVVNQLFTPCENGFTYNSNLQRCNCVDPFFGDRCEHSRCVHGKAVRGDYGWACECENFWFGKHCDLCGTYDGVNGTCFGDPPYPNSNLCRTDEYNFGEVEFLGAKCDLACFKVENERSIKGTAKDVYDMLLEKAPQDVLACPEASCYACDAASRSALCVDGFLKSVNSRVCDLACGPCTDEVCKPCSRRGECVLRGSSPICVCDPRSRGTGCQDLCPGVTEVFNGISSTLTGTECFANGVCNDFAECECYEDVEGTPRFIDNCKYECPTSDGVVCNGHGSCSLNNEGAFCECAAGWFGPSCTCSDGSVDPKTCANGDCNALGTCDCYDDDVQGHWSGQFCNQCAANYFTEITSCLQFCDPSTTCSSHASSCIVGETVFESNGLVKPCTIVTLPDGTLQYDGTCAKCACDANFNEDLKSTPIFTNFNDGKSLAYSCTDCTSSYYPKADTQVFDAEICTTSCTLDSCNNRGVCLRGSGQCACYGNCPADATLYDGTCLDVSVGMSPHISSASNCEVCESHWGPNLDIWQGSCTFYCNPAATAEDQLPQDCYVGNTIRDECVFCSGRASNCSSISGQPECSCEGDYTGKYCQNACGSCNNGVCEENKLYNFFLLDTPEYAKTGDNSFKCTCAPDLIDRVTFEEEMYDLVTHDLSKERTFQDMPEKEQYFGSSCQGSCKLGADGSVCNNYGECKTAPVRGLGGSNICTTDTDCNIDPNNPFVEDTTYYCHLEDVPTHWRGIRDRPLAQFDQCTDDEIHFVKEYIESTNWNDYCYEYMKSSMPSDLFNVDCSSCNQLVDDRTGADSLWTETESKCTAFLLQADMDTLQSQVSGKCSYAVASFNWESWCEFPSEDFSQVCPASCVEEFRKVDWVGDNGFCATLDTFTENIFLRDHVCNEYLLANVDECGFVPDHENSYDTSTSCFTIRETVLDPVTNRVITNPYSGSLNQKQCLSISQNQPEVCGSVLKSVNPVKQACDVNNLNVHNTGLNECQLRDKEYDFCTARSIVAGNGASWTECKLEIPKCMYCGGGVGSGTNMYETSVVFDLTDITANNYNPNPKTCCRPGDVLKQIGSSYQCFAASTYADVCRFDDCTQAVKGIDWASKLINLDSIKRLQPANIDSLSLDATRRSLNVSTFCSARRASDEIINNDNSLASFFAYCDFVDTKDVSKPYVWSFSDTINEIQKLELNVIKNNWWLLNVGTINIDTYDMEDYYTSGSNRLLSAGSSTNINIASTQTFTLFHTWFYLDEPITNDYIFSISFAKSTIATAPFLQLDVRNQKLFINNEETELFDGTSGWHRLELHFSANTTDVVVQNELNAEKILLNVPLFCGSTCLDVEIKQIILETPGLSKVLFHDLRLLEKDQDVALSYFEKPLATDGVSAVLSKDSCTTFRAVPSSIEQTLCPTTNCDAELKKVNFGAFCTSYFSIVELTATEKANICANDVACATRLDSWDYKSYYDSYTYNDRPQQTRTAACLQFEACDNLLESYNYVDLCESNLREVHEACEDFTTVLANWRSSFDKEGFCSSLETKRKDIEDMLKDKLSDCSSPCKSRIDKINMYDFCSNRAVYHGPYAPYSMSFNVSSACKAEIFTNSDITSDCHKLGTTGSVTGAGQCYAASCKCSDPTIGGDRCNIQCTSGSDGSSCNEASNLGTCCLSTGGPLTLANCLRDAYDPDVTIHAGQCVCFDDDVGGANCDIFCDKCSVSNGRCTNTGSCVCESGPYEETVRSNHYETDVLLVGELQMPFNWANKQAVGYMDGLSNEQEPLYLLYTSESPCAKSEIDRCCTWDDFADNKGNPLHADYDRNIVTASSETAAHNCSSAVDKCIVEAIMNNISSILIEGEVFTISNRYKNWPLKHQLRISDALQSLEPTNLYNPASSSQANFFNSKCPSYNLVNGYYRVEIQKSNYTKGMACYNSSKSVLADRGKSLWEVHQLCQQDDDCVGYWKDTGGFVRFFDHADDCSNKTRAYLKPAFTPVPVSTSKDVFFRNQWCKVKEVDNINIDGRAFFSGFISKIECNRVKDFIVSADFNTCKFPFFTYNKDQFDVYRIAKSNACTDDDIFDRITNTKVFDFSALKDEIQQTTGIINPKYCVAETFFQNITHFLDNGENGYCKVNEGAFGKCVLDVEFASNCECGTSPCRLDEYCYEKKYGTTSQFECHPCNDPLSPQPEKCCKTGEFYVNGVCKPICEESWACRYNAFSQKSSDGTQYVQNGVAFSQGTGPKPELFCDNSCYNIFSQTCESCEVCVASVPFKNPIDILKETKIGGYHYVKPDGTFSYNTSHGEIPFLRICQDTTNAIDNSEFALSVESKTTNTKVDFIRFDRTSQANPSSACGDTCTETCPATIDGVPCYGNGICNKDCTCSCFTFETNQKFVLSNVDGLGLTEVPDFSVSSLASKSPYRGADCSKTCPGWEDGMIGDAELTVEDKSFIMNELICSGHGTCLTNDAGTPQCQCETGYVNGVNSNCEFKCPGNGCSGHGECSVSLQGTSEIYIENLFLEVNFTGEVTRTIMEKAHLNYPSKTTYDALRDTYYAMPEAVEETASSEYASIRYLSKCPRSHPYPYHNGKYCCVFQTVANGTSINKRSAITECSPNNRLRCPTNDYFVNKPDSEIESKLRQRLGTDYVGTHFIDINKAMVPSAVCSSNIKTTAEEELCAEEARVISLNTFSSNPEHYTCDPNIALVSMRRNQRPYYDPLSVLQLGAGQVDNVLYSFNDVFCTNIIAAERNMNGFTLDEQPQPITLLECATCTCQKSAKSGFWDNVICDECQFGFHGESCSGMCPAVCGTINVGSQELFYEAYQRRIGSTLPCEEPVNQNSAFYFNCPDTNTLREVLNAQAIQWDESYERSVYCNDGRFSPGSCLACNAPLIGSLDVRLEDPRASCYRLSCPSNMEFFQRVNRLEDIYSVNLNLAIFYTNVEFALTGKNFGEAYSTSQGAGLSLYTPIDIYADCASNETVVQYHYCCPTHDIVVEYEALSSLQGYFAEKHDPESLSLHQCAEKALSSATYTIGGASVLLGPYKDTSKGFFAYDGQCTIFRGFKDLNLLYMEGMNLRDKGLFLRNVGQGFVEDDSYTVYRAYETCDSRTSREFATWHGSEYRTNTTKTISNTYELGCEFNNIYPSYFVSEATDDNIDGQLVGSSKDPYTSGGESMLDIIEVVNRDRCVRMFFEKCADGHESNIQNPFLTYYAFMRVHEYLEKTFPIGADQSGRCNIDVLKGIMWCPQCPRCVYSGTMPGVDFALNDTNSKCDTGYFPYCKSQDNCEENAWRETEGCEYNSPKPVFNLVDSIKQTVQFKEDVRINVGSTTIEECASIAIQGDAYRGFFYHANCGEPECPCSRVENIIDSSLEGNPGTFLYQIDYSKSNGINVFQQYVEKFTSETTDSSLMSWYVERMYQAIPDKYRYFKSSSNNALVKDIEQWLECTCIEDPNDMDHCENFDVTSCVKFNPLQFEWETLWHTRGSKKVPYEAPQKEVTSDDFHDVNGQGAVLRTSATLKTTVNFLETTIPTECEEPLMTSYEFIPTAKIYASTELECGKETVCSCDLQGVTTDGRIDYEPELIFDTLGNQLFHSSCMEQVGAAYSYSLNDCYNEAYLRFNFYEGEYFGSKGLFAVERPQITNRQLFSSDSYLDYDFKTSNELTCFVYKDIDSNALNARDLNFLDSSQSICLSEPNEARGCARSKQLIFNFTTNQVEGEVETYTNKCDSPVFIQSYRSPHVSQTGNVFSRVTPEYAGKVACYDYGPCFTIDANGLTGTRFCSCRPTKFTEKFPGVHYSNFGDTPLHQQPADQWTVVGQDFTTVFGYWTQVRDKAAGEAAEGFTETVFQTYEKELLNLCYNDMQIKGNELYQLVNRELQKDQYTHFQLLLQDVICPDFALLQQNFNYKTRGRFSANIWTKDDPLDHDGEAIDGSGHTMFQKIRVGNQNYNYIFGYAVVMLDYRQVNVSQLYFGDPNYGDPTLGTMTQPMPYESVIKYYCDAGEQPYRRFGPCVNLKNARIDGKIFLKHFTTTAFELKEIPTTTSTLNAGVRGDVILEHDTVILIAKDSKFYAVSNFIPASSQIVEKDQFRLFTNTYNARSAELKPMFVDDGVYSKHMCAPHKATMTPLKYEPVMESHDAFMFMRPQNEEIVKQGVCQPKQSSDSTDTWGNMPVCEELAAAAINGVSYAPSCSCPAGFANMKYSDYNQPWSHHGGCSSIPHDKQGAFVDYKPCNGRQTCNFLDTPFCCGFDDVECEQHYKGRCVASNGKPALDSLLNEFCNRPFAGCSKKQRNGIAIDEDDIECGGPRTQQETYDGMSVEWVKISDYSFGSRTTNNAVDPMHGVVYIDGKPVDRMKSNFATLTMGCYPCTNGRYNAESGKVECKGCPAGRYSMDVNNPWQVPPVNVNGFLEASRGVDVYEYEWFKINNYPPQTLEWHEANEWIVKSPLPPYELTEEGIWRYNPTISQAATVDHEWVKNDYATECSLCPDNFASIPLDESNYLVGDENLKYKGFPVEGTRSLTNNKQCLVCPPGYDTGSSNHLLVGVTTSVAEECPEAYPYAFSVKDKKPFYGSHCCKTEMKRINSYYFHANPEDGCDDYVPCNSKIEYATNGFYCVDASKERHGQEFTANIYNNVRKHTCTYYSFSKTSIYGDLGEKATRAPVTTVASTVGPTTTTVEPRTTAAPTTTTVASVTTSTNVTIYYNASTYEVCQSDTAVVVWNGNHNIQEVTFEGYTNYSITEHIGNETLGFYPKDHVEVVEGIFALPGETRYFVCSAHPSNKFTITCPASSTETTTQIPVTTTQATNAPVVVSTTTTPTTTPTASTTVAPVTSTTAAPVASTTAAPVASSTTTTTTTTTTTQAASTATVLEFSNSGFSHYVYNGQNDPDISLCLNEEYRFKRTTSGHPLVVVRDADCSGCSSGTYSSYSNPLITVSGSSEADLTFTQAGTYYYLCTIHTPMVGKITVNNCGRRRLLQAEYEDENIICPSRNKSSYEILEIVADSQMKLSVEYSNSVREVKKMITLNESNIFELNDDTFFNLRITKIVENYNLLLDKDVSCNGVFIDEFYDIVFFESNLYHASYEKIVLGSNLNEDECARKTIDYHERHVIDNSTDNFFTIENDICYTYPRGVCNGDATTCVPGSGVGKTMQINPEGSTKTGASCFLQSVLDSKEGSPFCRKCPIGKFNSRSGANCLPCSQGKYQNEEGQTSCKVCDNSKYQFSTGSATCLDCPAGSENFEGSGSKCNLCKSGTYSDDSSLCKSCPAGKSISSNYASIDISNVQLAVVNQVTASGPLVNYDSRFDYTNALGYAETDIFGNYVKGFTPFFEGLQHMQLTSHDDLSDCKQCKDGFISQVGDADCHACSSGKVANAENTQCIFCTNGIVQYSQNTFISSGEFVCNPLEQIGEAGDDNGIIVAREFDYNVNSNFGFKPSEYIEVASEESAKTYCMQNYRCQGYSKKYLKDGNVRWRVPKFDEVPSNLQTTYNEFNDQVPDLYSFEKSLSDQDCILDASCVAYYVDTVQNKEYNVLPFEEEEHRRVDHYRGDTFSTEKEAVKYCASQQSCDGVSRIDFFEDALFDQVIDDFFIMDNPEKTIITKPDQKSNANINLNIEISELSCREYSLHYQYNFWQINENQLCELSNYI